jgi:hypothetical protein
MQKDNKNLFWPFHFNLIINKLNLCQLNLFYNKILLQFLTLLNSNIFLLLYSQALNHNKPFLHSKVLEKPLKYPLLYIKPILNLN